MLKSFISFSTNNCMSASTENFLKTIYSFHKLEARDTRPGSIARALGISNAAATDMARKLADKNLVRYAKYQPLELTKEGEKIALNVLRKHRLWESFLRETFNLSLIEIHREAEMLEHQTSDYLAEKISEHLGHPTFDPHGDPIPDSKGKMPVDRKSMILTKAKAGDKYEITRLINRDEEFFQFCKGNMIEMGSELVLINHYSKNKLTEILVDGTKLLLSDDFACLIYIKSKK
jgi:DtxR family Mn-dependent transcriptional regulator